MPNINTGRVAGPNAIETDGVLVNTPACNLSPGQHVTWCIRPHQIQITANGSLPATVIDAVELPTVHEATLQLAPNLTLIVRDPSQPLEPGGRCHVSLPPDAIHVWPVASTQPSADQPAAVTATDTV